MSTKFYRLFLAVGLAMALGACSSSPSSSGGGGEDELGAPAEAGTDAVPPTTADAPPNIPGEEPPPPGDAPPPPPDAAAKNMTNDPAKPPEPDLAQAPAPAVDAPPPVAPEAAPPVAAAPVPSSPEQPAPVQANPPSSRSGGSSDVAESYTVQQGDTLMKISFEVYGDLFKWRKIYNLNKSKIADFNAVPPGTVLSLDRSVTPVAVSRNGEKYAIKAGDTLGSISNEVYGTKRKWKRLWENNRELIHNPDRIFAGFYLYYTFTPQDREEMEKFKGEVKQQPLANASGAPAEGDRAPGSATNAPPQDAPASN